MKVGDIRFIGKSDDGSILAEKILSVKKTRKGVYFTTSFPFKIRRK